MGGASDTVIFSVAFEPAFVFTIPVVVVLGVVPVLVAAVLFLRWRRSVKSLQAVEYNGVEMFMG